MMSADSARISATMPLVFLLAHTLWGIMDKALEAEWPAKEDFMASEGLKGNSKKYLGEGHPMLHHRLKHGLAANPIWTSGMDASYGKRDIPDIAAEQDSRCSS